MMPFKDICPLEQSPATNPHTLGWKANWLWMDSHHTHGCDETCQPTSSPNLESTQTLQLFKPSPQSIGSAQMSWTTNSIICIETSRKVVCLTGCLTLFRRLILFYYVNLSSRWRWWWWRSLINYSVIALNRGGKLLYICFQLWKSC